ncbi:hypothetical protein [Methylobacterium sp.]|nr:hypothetical protein [Methylobacterium sp.]
MTTLVTLPFVASAAALAGTIVGFRTVVPMVAVTFVAAAAWVLA